TSCAPPPRRGCARRAPWPAPSRRPASLPAPSIRATGWWPSAPPPPGGGGPLLAIAERLPANCPPTVITQHMPATFTKSFAERLNRACAAEVREARDGDPLGVGKVYLAPGGDSHLEVDGVTHRRCRVTPGPPVSGHCPSVDKLFESVARTAKARAVG